MKRIKKINDMKKTINVDGVAVLIATIIFTWVILSLVINTLVEYNDDSEVVFDNSYIERAIEEALNDEHITKAEALKVKKLSLENVRELYDLSDFTAFENLEVLTIKESELKSLNGVQNLKKLIILECEDNQISDISSLYNAKLQNLKVLSLKRNNIISIDMIATELENLEECDVSYCKLDGVLDVGNSEKLTTLTLKGNSIKGINGNLSSLENLFLNENDITDLKDIESFESLKQLNLQNNLLDSIEELCRFENLHSLDIRGNQIKDLSPLEELIELNTIFIDKNVDRNQINFIIDNFRDGDIYTKQWILDKKYDLLGN